MPTEILVPEIDALDNNAKLTQWLNKQGDSLQQGDQIAEIETEKALIEVYVPVAGKLVSILLQEGSPIMAGTIAGLIDEG